MDVLQQWQLAELVETTLDLIINGMLGLLAAIFFLRMMLEVSRGMFSNQFRYSMPSFFGILATLLGVIAYKDIMFLIGDSFFAIANALRGSSETAFRLTSVWDAIASKYAVPGEETSVFDLVDSWLGDGIPNPWDLIQNWWGFATIMTWSSLGVLFRWAIIIFKNLVYVLMLFSGPIPLVLSLIPALSGFATHWVKNFITVCYWNVTIALLDVIMNGLQFEIVKDFAFGGDEEMTIALLSMVTAICYFFVPYLTSLAIGQSVVAMAGNKLVMTPIATALAAGRLAGGAASGSGAKAATSTASNSNTSGSSRSGSANSVTNVGSGGGGYSYSRGSSFDNVQSDYYAGRTARNHEPSHDSYGSGPRRVGSGGGSMRIERGAIITPPAAQSNSPIITPHHGSSGNVIITPPPAQSQRDSKPKFLLPPKR